MRIAILVFPGVQLLDLVGPMDVFHEAIRQAGRPAPYKLHILAEGQEALTGSNGMRFLPDSSWRRAPRDIDTLLVAGSPGISSDKFEPELLVWLQRQARRVRRIGAVCTGAFVLAAAGLLDGRRATTHWNASGKLAALYPGITVEPDHIYIRDGATYTSAGVTAGMDLALALVEEDLGREVAMRVARELVMFLKRPGGQSQFSAHLAAQTAERSAIRTVQEWVLADLRRDLSVEALAARAGMSMRNFARIFKRDAQCTPAEFVEGARLDAARRMLEESDAPLKRIAAHCGFGEVNTLRRAFLRRLGASPVEYRKRFRADRNIRPQTRAER
jgi:transcriptional regulator GlxA family with amidase domain